MLGGAPPPPFGAVVLGGLAGVRQRWQRGVPQERLLALGQMLQYGKEGLDLLITALNDPHPKVQLQALRLLWHRPEPKVRQALKGFWHYQLWDCQQTLAQHNTPDRKSVV